MKKKIIRIEDSYGVGPFQSTYALNERNDEDSILYNFSVRHFDFPCPLEDKGIKHKFKLGKTYCAYKSIETTTRNEKLPKLVVQKEKKGRKVVYRVLKLSV